MDRWRRPIVPLAIEPVDQVLLLPDGRRVGESRFILAPFDIERIRLGYACAKCLGVFERPWPERCIDCGAPIRSKQAEYFANEFGGTERLGPSTTIADELERLKEEA